MSRRGVDPGDPARDVLHRLVDDLDEEDAELLASVAATSPTDQSQTDRDVDSGIWPEQAKTALRELLGRSDEDPRRYVVLFLVAQPPEELRTQLAAALAAWRGAPEDMEPARVRREQVVADALGSVRAEGLEPSAAALRDSAEYEAGRITAEELYQSALRRTRSMTGR